MPKTSRKETLRPPRNPWEGALEETLGADRSQAGDEDANEASLDRNPGIDATGDGGYGGDAALAGHDASVAQPDRPLDDEIHGDPRTHDGESFPDEAKALDERQGPLGRESIDEDE